MGHMGNLTSAQVRFALDAVERTLAAMGRKVAPGTGRQAVDGILKAR
jgi:aspartate aminotransferase-like enzyme